MLCCARVFVVTILLSVVPITGACQNKEPSPMPDESQSLSNLVVEDVIGLWRLEAANSPRTCLIALSRFPAGGDFGAQVEECSTPGFDGVQRWRLLAEGFELLTSEGLIVGHFRRTGVDSFVETDGSYRLDRAPIR